MKYDVTINSIESCVITVEAEDKVQAREKADWELQNNMSLKWFPESNEIVDVEEVEEE